MPEVIDLLSSTPPPREDRPRQPPVPTKPAAPSNPPLPATSFLSDDSIDVSLFNYDDLDNPTNKRRRVSEEPQSRHETTTRVVSKQSCFQFSDEDFGLPPPPPPPGPSEPKPSTSAWDVLESDPIVFTSSAPEPAGRPPVIRKSNFTQTNTITIDDDDFDFDDYNDDNDGNGKKSAGGAVARRVERDEIEEFSDQIPLPDLNELIALEESTKSTANPLYSNRTASLLASLEERPKAGRGGKVASKPVGRPRKDKDIDDELSDDLVEPRKPARKTSSKPTTADKEAKAREREAAKAQREREKQLDKERKQKLKEEKAKKKQLAQDISEVNKLKVDKKNSTPEMLLDMSSSLEDTNVGNQSIEFMKRLGVEHTFFASSISNIVRWRRKVTAKFNEGAGYWEPCPLHIRQEEHVLCLLTAQDFVDMVIAPADSDETDTLEQHVLKLKNAYPNCKPIYLIEGLGVWMRKNKNSRNRAYQAEVRRQFEQSNDAPATTATGRPRKKANKPETTPPIDDDTVEDALLQLQVTYSCLIHHSNAAPESAEWIKNFTEHVSTIPYRLERMEGNDSAFCMDVGQVKCGDDKEDTFIKMLQEVNRVTASMAYGIIPKYPSVTDLVKAMRTHGPGMLEDVKKSANKTGGVTESRIGPAASKRLYKVFTGLDPSSTDI
ncbi:hypothetical protein ASPWEDRAFT_50588 [Aspergillus wentii DTO 134E9]|uniref:ERCC4 domain-containing protein n=1 Tax=Aspergillus wentii DTO 134E9 TaxID=1073089 RepID=A0A1L9RQZ8_ASPWE|nr:uncharacterized protein ASPWEDRAFT_50588 [Aspergillus wentii DTO 134E9]KAI9928140.1 hypothetical protein MW887_002173 [Aspergillus wentii]OJJ37380.1 hypothetical protein ASPWEDRAFT_50588 [Aspergillus wentii DTO 134E9]